MHAPRLEFICGNIAKYEVMGVKKKRGEPFFVSDISIMVCELDGFNFIFISCVVFSAIGVS